jgi:hypothetical protein
MLDFAISAGRRGAPPSLPICSRSAANGAPTRRR